MRKANESPPPAQCALAGEGDGLGKINHPFIIPSQDRITITQFCARDGTQPSADAELPIVGGGNAPTVPVKMVEVGVMHLQKRNGGGLARVDDGENGDEDDGSGDGRDDGRDDDFLHDKDLLKSYSDNGELRTDFSPSLCWCRGLARPAELVETSTWLVTNLIIPYFYNFVNFNTLVIK